jgi:integrase
MGLWTAAGKVPIGLRLDPTMKLTQASVKGLSLPSGSSDKLFFDDDLPGFGFRIRDGGKRTWIAQYRLGKKQRRVTIGTAANTTAEEARKRAKGILSRVHLGGDPQIEKAEARVQAASTVQSAVGRYLDEWAPRLKPRSMAEVERHLRRHFAALSEIPLAKVTRATVAAELARIAKQNGPYAANRARAALSALYSWAMGEGLADQNPVIGTNKATDEIARDRVLSPAELSAIWQEAGDGDYAAIVKLLILTGQRREEVGGMLWPEVDLDGSIWRIRAERTKNGLPHDLPLSRPTVAILRDRAKREQRDLVFGAGDGPFQGWSNAKSALDERVLARLRKKDKKAKLPAWRLHDIRRTVATGLADIGVLPHVVEAILNHVSGHKAGVAGVYNRASYAAEKRMALDLWAEHVVAAHHGTRLECDATAPAGVTA